MDLSWIRYIWTQRWRFTYSGGLDSDVLSAAVKFDHASGRLIPDGASWTTDDAARPNDEIWSRITRQSPSIVFEVHANFLTGVNRFLDKKKSSIIMVTYIGISQRSFGQYAIEASDMRRKGDGPRS